MENLEELTVSTPGYTAPPATYILDVSEGWHQPISIGWPFGHDNRHTHIDAEEGASIEIVGSGPSLSHIHAHGMADNATIQIGNLKNVSVTIRGVTIHCGARAAIHAGVEAPGYLGSMRIRLIDCIIVADTPPSGYGNTSNWGVFAYNCYVTMLRVKFFCKHLSEHALYAHNPLGAMIVNSHIAGTGSEGFKFTNRDHEGGAPANGLIHINGCTIRDWKQEWAWRGGAAIVVQGARCNVLIEKTLMYGTARSPRCLMIDDGGDDRPYNNDPPNGWVLVRNTGMEGRLGTPNYPAMVRIGSLGFRETRPVVSAALFKGCGVYGYQLSMQFSPDAIPTGQLRVEGCNTPKINEVAGHLGMLSPGQHTSGESGPEASFTLPDRIAKVSEGYEA